MKNQQFLCPISLNGDDLPWVLETKHLGTKVVNIVKGMKGDMMEKRVIYINKNNELRQEFWFAHPKTIIKANSIFNSSLYGSVLWDLLEMKL